jgi:hypothetical protein
MYHHMFSREEFRLFGKQLRALSVVLIAPLGGFVGIAIAELILLILTQLEVVGPISRSIKRDIALLGGGGLGLVCAIWYMSRRYAQRSPSDAVDTGVDNELGRDQDS